MAAKSHLRNGRPILLAVSTNDALGAGAENIGRLLARKHYYFVPFGQDDPEKKPASMVAHFEKLPQAPVRSHGRETNSASAPIKMRVSEIPRIPFSLFFCLAIPQFPAPVYI